MNHFIGRKGSGGRHRGAKNKLFYFGQIIANCFLEGGGGVGNVKGTLEGLKGKKGTEDFPVEVEPEIRVKRI